MAYRWIAVVALVLAITWVLFVPAADWLAHQDVGSAKGPMVLTARDAARGRLLTLGAGLVAAAALAFTARNLALYRRTIELGSSAIDVTIGGIYALERCPCSVSSKVRCVSCSIAIV
jgi:hypothetical protein